MSRLVRVLTGAALVGAVCLPATWAAGAAPSAPIMGPVTVRTSPAVAGVSLSLAGRTEVTDVAGTVTFNAVPLDAARVGVRLVHGQLTGDTRVTLLAVAADQRHAQGARLLVAKVAVAHAVLLEMSDRAGLAIPNSDVTSLTLRSSDAQTKTVRPAPDRSPLWLEQEVSDRRRGALIDATRSISWTVMGVRVKGVSVAIGRVSALEPWASTWQIPLAGYPFNVALSVVPALPGVHVRLGQLVTETDQKGNASFYAADLTNVANQVSLASPSAGPDKRVALVRVSRANHDKGARRLVLALNVQAAVRLRFVDLAGRRVDVPGVSSVVLDAPLGQRIRMTARQLQGPVWLPASRLTQSTPPKARRVSYTVAEALALGTNAVFANEQRFDPMTQSGWTVQLHLYGVRVQARDLLFGSEAPGKVMLEAPDGSRRAAPLQQGMAVLGRVPRGRYEVTVAGGARTLQLPVRVARDQTLSVRVVSWWDVLTVGVLAMALAILILRAGMRAHRRRVRRQAEPIAAPLTRLTTGTHVGATVLVLCLAISVLAVLAPRPAHADALCPSASISKAIPAGSQPRAFPMPVWSYYYIWYNQNSWRRAKIDAPQLGCYSSDDSDVMRAHVRLAKHAGITGFLVSWKHTARLDARLKTLSAIAASEHFSLGIVYESLDVARRPTSAAVVSSDLSWLAKTYGNSPAFSRDGRPVAIWAGSAHYPAAAIKSVVVKVRPGLSVYASAKSVQDYERVAAWVEGNAYYWSSADPASDTVAPKLQAIGKAVHAHHQHWLAPAAPGFDGRSVGGSRTVARNGGSSLRTSINAALTSAPDALAIISWNEWSENTYIEPSRNYGQTELTVLASVLHGSVPALGSVDSSEIIPGERGWHGWQAAILIMVFCFIVVVVIEYRRRRLGREAERSARDDASPASPSGGSHQRGRDGRFPSVKT